ncbi:hypothetical protein SEA_MEYRAN_52 [Gordonia phage Meyran]|nr:hypothetical protein SEA_MEYRAN_52 [Gordonia phage Meyran]
MSGTVTTYVCADCGEAWTLRNTPEGETRLRSLLESHALTVDPQATEWFCGGCDLLWTVQGDDTGRAFFRNQIEREHRDRGHWVTRVERCEECRSPRIEIRPNGRAIWAHLSDDAGAGLHRGDGSDVHMFCRPVPSPLRSRR